MSDVQRAIQTLELDYAQQKEGFEKWKVENAALAQHDSYRQYVEQFQAWEKTVLEKLRELRSSVTRLPIAPEPETPMIDLDTQLDNVLKDITAPQFIVAFMAMAQKDPTFLKKAFEVVIEDSRATGFSNPILPQRAVHSSQSTPSFGGYHNHNKSSASNTAFQTSANPASAAASSTGIYLPPHQQPYIPGSSLLSNRYAATPPSASSSGSYTLTPYGVLPEGWTVDPAIRKQPKPVSSPAREYRAPLNLPFKDFSQS